MNRQLMVTELPSQAVLDAIQSLETKGWIEQTDHYCYLKVDDKFVHDTFPLLRSFGHHIEKPDYFASISSVGAHISVIYPEEMVDLMIENVGQIHRFQVDKLLKVQFQQSAYFVLSVVAPSLGLLRQMHHLSANPVFKGYEIMFHLTIGIQPNLLFLG